MYKELLIYFLFFNIQFIFDMYYKSYQLKFLESIETELNMNYFLLFNFFYFILIFIRIYDKQMNLYYLEYPTKRLAFNHCCKKINNMSKLWLEQNSSTKFKTLVDTTSTRYFSYYNDIFELYGGIIRVNTNIYIMYNINNFSLHIMLGYFLLYTLFYKYIILKTRDKKKENSKKSNELNIINTNLYVNYFNCCIGNYHDKYVNVIRENTKNINKYEYENIYLEKIFTGTLQIFPKLLIFIFIYNYLTNNCLTKCTLFLWPLYNITETVIYQYEYILHILNYGYINPSYTYYNEFNEIYENHINEKKKILPKNLPINIVNETIEYKNRSKITYNINLDFKHKNILIEGKSGLGKSTLCKIISGYFNSYQNINNNKIIYIPQDIYLNTENRTLYNVITQNDYKICNKNINLFYYIIDNIVPFSDIKNSLNNDLLYKILENKSFSGGQEKRIYLAMWLYYIIININKYDILILDEPDKSLDTETVNKLLNNILNEPMLSKLNIIVISHNIEDKYSFDKIYKMINDNNIIKLT